MAEGYSSYLIKREYPGNIRGPPAAIERGNAVENKNATAAAATTTTTITATAATAAIAATAQSAANNKQQTTTFLTAVRARIQFAREFNSIFRKDFDISACNDVFTAPPHPTPWLSRNPAYTGKYDIKSAVPCSTASLSVRADKGPERNNKQQEKKQEPQQQEQQEQQAQKSQQSQQSQHSNKKNA